MKDNNNIPPFYPGQKVMAVNTHSQRDFIKGDKFVVSAVYQLSCCKVWVVQIGLSLGVMRSGLTKCRCGTFFKTGAYNVYDCNMFRPVQEQTFPLMTYAKVMEKEKELISAN